MNPSLPFFSLASRMDGFGSGSGSRSEPVAGGASGSHSNGSEEVVTEERPSVLDQLKQCCVNLGRSPAGYRKEDLKGILPPLQEDELHEAALKEQNAALKDLLKEKDAQLQLMTPQLGDAWEALENANRMIQTLTAERATMDAQLQFRTAEARGMYHYYLAAVKEKDAAQRTTAELRAMNQSLNAALKERDATVGEYIFAFGAKIADFEAVVAENAVLNQQRGEFYRAGLTSYNASFQNHFEDDDSWMEKTKLEGMKRVN